MRLMILRKLRIVLFLFWLVLHYPQKKEQNEIHDDNNGHCWSYRINPTERRSLSMEIRAICRYRCRCRCIASH
ncbi:hypothetical protein ACB098_10G010300 [Castanea mollissima]